MEYMYLQASSAKSVNYHFSAKFIIFVALSNVYIFHSKESSLSSKEDLGHSKYFSPLKNNG